MSNSHKTLRAFSTKVTPQSQPIPGSTQVPNSAGGHAWKVDCWTQLDRFLILGTEGGTYYIDQSTLTQDNAKNVIKCIQTDGPRAVARIIEISTDGRAPKNDPALFALALCFAFGDLPTKHAAEAALLSVARIGTHLFHFAQYVEQFRGWGRLLKRAVGGWYLGKRADKLGEQVIKYRQRDGWSHKDLLILSHPIATSPEHAAIFDHVVHGTEGEALPAIVHGYLRAAAAEAVFEGDKAGATEEILDLIKTFGLQREMLPTQFLKDPKVWEALLPNLGLTAVIRNLGNMSKCGLLVTGSDATRYVNALIQDGDALKAARVHPIQLLSALLTYKRGSGVRGSGEWKVVTSIVNALDAGFYKAFGAVEPSGARQLLALDVSGSMSIGEIAGVPGLTPRVGSAAMALITANVESDYHVIGFTAGRGGYHSRGNQSLDGVVPLDVTPRRRLDDVVRTVSDLNFGATDCALPMLYALKEGLLIDSFVVYTDSETWAGDIHPTQALKMYREKTGIQARLTVVGMTSNGFSIADPNDPGMLDVVGFDTATPQLISDFGAGKL